MKYTLLLSVLFVSALSLVQSASVVETNALLDLFNATNGPNWLHTWNVSADPCSSWFGITCSVSGNVTALILDFNHLDGTVPSSIADLTSLVTLDLSNNFLSGDIPSFVGTHGSPTSMISIDLSSNLFTGNIPEGIFQLPNLRSLSLKVNQLDGELPSSLGSSITALYLSTNHLIGSLAPLDTLTSLKQLYLDHNQFSVMTNTTFPELLNLQASNNPDLHPVLPSDISSLMPLLQQISLSNTGMTGTIPSSLGGFSALTVLDLSGNSLSGTIPANLGSDSALQYVNMSFNHFSGEIPNSLGDLANLISLDLSHNSFNGSVPVFLSSPAPYNVSVQCNNFCGVLPTWCASSRCSSCGLTVSPCFGSNNVTGGTNSTGGTTGSTTGRTTGSTSTTSGSTAGVPPPSTATTGGRGSTGSTSTGSQVPSSGSIVSTSAFAVVAALLLVQLM